MCIVCQHEKMMNPFVPVEHEANLLGQTVETARSIPGNTSTTATLVVDGFRTTDRIDFEGDLDWFRLDLTAGQLVIITLKSLFSSAYSSLDTYLTIYDSNGFFLNWNDDHNLGVPSRMIT